LHLAQGVAVGGAHRHLACRLLLFARFALDGSLMAFQAIFIEEYKIQRIDFLLD
jgi:hypothetical protein